MGGSLDFIGERMKPSERMGFPLRPIRSWLLYEMTARTPLTVVHGDRTSRIEVLSSIASNRRIVALITPPFRRLEYAQSLIERLKLQLFGGT
jgi:hypothetical protein